MLRDRAIYAAAFSFLCAGIRDATYAVDVRLEWLRIMVMTVALPGFLLIATWSFRRHAELWITLFSAGTGLCAEWIAVLILWRQRPPSAALGWWVPLVGAGLVIMVLGVSFSLVLVVRNKYRPKYPAGKCAKCGYELRGLPLQRCPECGNSW